MGLVLTLILVMCVVIAFVGGGFYLLWVKTRPKKQTWIAHVYQLGEGIRQPRKDKHGEVISTLEIQDLHEYAIDTLEKVEKDTGITVYRLVNLGKVVPAVTNDVVSNWGPGKKIVNVLLHEDTCTLIKKGYNKQVGEIIFEPLSHDRVNMIKGEMSIRKDRLQSSKDILQAITPWIVTGMSMLALVAIATIMMQGLVNINDEQVKTAKLLDGTAKDLVEAQRLIYGVQRPEANPVGPQPNIKVDVVPE